MWSEIPNAANYSDHALRQLFAPHAHSTFLRIRDIVQRARDDDGEQASACENDFVRGNRCDSSTAISVAQLLPPAHTMPTTNRASAVSLIFKSEDRDATPHSNGSRPRRRRLLQGQKAPAEGRTDGPTASVVPCRRRRRCFFQLSISIQCSSISLTPFPRPPRPLRPPLPRPLSLLLKCELNAFSLQSRRPTDRPTDRPRE